MLDTFGPSLLGSSALNVFYSVFLAPPPHPPLITGSKVQDFAEPSSSRGVPQQLT